MHERVALEQAVEPARKAESDLQPESCPFCGNRGISREFYVYASGYTCVICKQCNAHGPLVLTCAERCRVGYSPEAIMAWNRRARRLMPRDDETHEYRYDGMDEEDGQHWLEEVKNGEPTERYVPIVLRQYVGVRRREWLKQTSLFMTQMRRPLLTGTARE